MDMKYNYDSKDVMVTILIGFKETLKQLNDFFIHAEFSFDNNDFIPFINKLDQLHADCLTLQTLMAKEMNNGSN